MLRLAEQAEVSMREAELIIGGVRDAVAQWPDCAEQAGVRTLRATGLPGSVMVGYVSPPNSARREGRLGQGVAPRDLRVLYPTSLPLPRARQPLTFRGLQGPQSLQPSNAAPARGAVPALTDQPHIAHRAVAP